MTLTQDPQFFLIHVNVKLLSYVDITNVHFWALSMYCDLNAWKVFVNLKEKLIQENYNYLVVYFDFPYFVKSTILEEDG